MDPDLRQRIARMYRRSAIVGAVTLAVCVGAILAGNHSPAVIGGAICFALFTGGQVWAGRRN